ncbi:hypothetical protein Tco_0666945 [Tanacetum coccineum]
MTKWNINRTRSCSDVVAFACVILSLLIEDNLCAYDCYMNIMWVCHNINAPAGRLLGAYDLGIVIPRAVVHADDKTSGDARSWFLQIYKLTNIIVDVFEYHFQAKEMISRIELHVSRL